MLAPTRRRGLFGAPMHSPMGSPYDLSAAPGTSSPDLSGGAQDAITPTYKKPSTANLIIGTIGDTLSQIGGGQGTYLAGLAQQRALAMRGQQAQQERAAEYSDWVRKKEYEQQHPSAASPTSLQQNYEYLKTINPAAAESYLQSQTTAPPIVQTNPDGTKTIYPAGQIPRTAAPRQVIQQLPAGAKPIGGAAPSGSGTFPYR